MSINFNIISISQCLYTPHTLICGTADPPVYIVLFARVLFWVVHNASAGPSLLGGHQLLLQGATARGRPGAGREKTDTKDKTRVIGLLRGPS